MAITGVRYSSAAECAALQLPPRRAAQTVIKERECRINQAFRRIKLISGLLQVEFRPRRTRKGDFDEWRTASYPIANLFKPARNHTRLTLGNPWHGQHRRHHWCPFVVTRRVQS